MCDVYRYLKCPISTGCGTGLDDLCAITSTLEHKHLHQFSSVGLLVVHHSKQFALLPSFPVLLLAFLSAIAHSLALAAFHSLHLAALPAAVFASCCLWGLLGFMLFFIQTSASNFASEKDGQVSIGSNVMHRVLMVFYNHLVPKLSAFNRS